MSFVMPHTKLRSIFALLFTLLLYQLVTIVRQTSHQRPRFTDAAVDVPVVTRRTDKQVLYLSRHGDRWDYANKRLLRDLSNWPEHSRPGDSALSDLGYKQSREFGQQLGSMLAADGISSSERITWMTSPYLRNIQTSREAIRSLSSVVKGAESMQVYFELALVNRNKPGDKANITEVVDYHWANSPEPINRTLRDRLGIPEPLEDRREFRTRCEETLKTFHQLFPYEPGTTFVFMTHGSNLREYKGILTGIEMTEEEYRTAKPCSITKYTRQSDTDRWELETLLYSGHISEFGATK